MVKIFIQYLVLGFLFLLAFSCSNGQEPKSIDIHIVERIPEGAEPRSPIMVSYDTGKTWKAVGQELPQNAQLSFMKTKGDKIVAATDNEGLFISTDNFTTWKQIGTGLPGKKILSLFIVNDIIYTSVYQLGIYFSENEGDSWISLNYDLPDLKVQSLFKKDNRLIAATDSGVFVLEDGQMKWESVLPNGQFVSLNEYEDKIIVGGVTGLYLSEDKGQNWKSIHNIGAIHYSEIIDGKIFGMYISGELLISDDWGKTWTTANYSPKEGSYIYDVAKVGDQYFLSNNYGTHLSADGGQNWNHIYFEEDWGIFEFLVKDNVIYGGTRTWREYRGKSK